MSMYCYPIHVSELSLFLCLFTVYQSIAMCCHSACTGTLFMPISMYCHSVPVIVRLIFPCPCPVAISMSIVHGLSLCLICQSANGITILPSPYPCSVILSMVMYCHSPHTHVLSLCPCLCTVFKIGFQITWVPVLTSLFSAASCIRYYMQGPSYKRL